jgi:hypothetical protein
VLAVPMIALARGIAAVSANGRRKDR